LRSNMRFGVALICPVQSGGSKPPSGSGSESKSIPVSTPGWSQFRVRGPVVVWNGDIDRDPESDPDGDGCPQNPQLGGAAEVQRIGPEARIARQHRVSLWQK